ncbi:MAG: hypothetical protein AB1491_03365 [Thermodesulfobacteriota bacterium]
MKTPGRRAREPALVHDRLEAQMLKKHQERLEPGGMIAPTAEGYWFRERSSG